MSRATDVNIMDYFRAIPATNLGVATLGQVVPCLGMAGWSFTAFSSDGAKGDFSIQFSDFHGRGKMTFPVDTGRLFLQGATVSIASGGSLFATQVARFNDPTCASACMRVTFTPTTGSVGTAYAALTIRAQ